MPPHILEAETLRKVSQQLITLKEVSAGSQRLPLHETTVESQGLNGLSTWQPSDTRAVACLTRAYSSTAVAVTSKKSQKSALVQKKPRMSSLARLPCRTAYALSTGDL